MGLSELVGDAQYEELMVAVPASSLVHGALRLEDVGGGWVRPHRFGISQERALGSVQAWHPGLFRAMALCTAGVTVQFQTDSSEVVLEVEPDPLPKGSLAIIAEVDAASPDMPRPLDGVSADIDGRHVPCVAPDDRNLVSLSLEAASPNGEKVLHLPGMGERHVVRVWLPCLSGCTLGRVLGDGTYLEPVPARQPLVVVGDSIAQGFVAGDPALSWPSLLADRLGLGILNQGVGGQVFQPGMLAGLDSALSPAAVVVALGENYRYEACTQERVRADVRGLLGEVASMWPDVPCWVLTPLWHSERIHRTNPRSCFSQVAEVIRDEARATGAMTVVPGSRLLDADATLMADGYEHPNANGSAMVAERLALAMEVTSEPQSVRRERALAVLADAPVAALPLLEMVRRGIGEVVYADEGCVFLREGRYDQVIWAPNRHRAKQVLRTLAEPDFLLALGSNIVRDAARVMGFRTAAPCHLCVYEGTGPLPVDPAFDVRPLDVSFASHVLDTYSHPEYLGDGELEDLLSRGLILGGFEDGELVGYVGEHPQGSIGMLEVLPEYRGRGWATALESAKVNAHLACGYVPWCEVWPDNQASLDLQRKLGFSVYPEKDMVFFDSFE